MASFITDLGLDSVIKIPQGNPAEWVVNAKGEITSLTNGIVYQGTSFLKGFNAESLLGLASNGVNKALAAIGVSASVAGPWGMAASAIITLLGSIFGGRTAPPPPEIAGFDWQEFSAALENKKFINARMAEALGAIVSGNIETVRLPKELVRQEVRSQAGKVFDDFLTRLKSKRLNKREYRQFALFAASTTPKILAEMVNDPRDMDHVAALISLG